MIQELPDRPELLGYRLQNAGYGTCYTGKWHLGSGGVPDNFHNYFSFKWMYGGRTHHCSASIASDCIRWVVVVVGSGSLLQTSDELCSVLGGQLIEGYVISAFNHGVKFFLVDPPAFAQVENRRFLSGTHFGTIR